MYASPAWYSLVGVAWGYACAGERDRFKGFFRQTKCFGYLSPTAPTAEVMSDRADAGLFRVVRSNPSHALHALLPAMQSHGHNLRPRPHKF